MKYKKSTGRLEFLRNSILIAAGLTSAPGSSISNLTIKPGDSVMIHKKQYFPVRLGVVDYNISSRWSPENKDRFFMILEQLGLTHVDFQLHPFPSGNQNSLMTAVLKQIDLDMRQHSMTYTLNVEDSNWREEYEITPGVNEYHHPGGLHRWDLRMEWLKPLLSTELSTQQAFQGVLYDECEHMQLCNNKYSNNSVQKALGRDANFDKPFLADTHGMDIETAYNQLVVACQKLREEHYEGWTVSPGKFAFSHVGYRPEDLKVAMVGIGGGDNFQSVDEKDNIVFSGNTGVVENKNRVFHKLNFSDFQEEGIYRLHCGKLESKPFPIRKDIWMQPLFKAINFFFCQRYGYEVPGVHLECHKDWQGFLGDEKKIINGGWHDAGGLSQGHWRTAMSCYAMMCNIESLEKLKDLNELSERIRSELVWGLEWLLKTDERMTHLDSSGLNVTD